MINIDREMNFKIQSMVIMPINPGYLSPIRNQVGFGARLQAFKEFDELADRG